MFSMQSSTITLLETHRGILGHGPIYEDGIKIAVFTDHPERIVCAPSFLRGHDDARQRFLAAAREWFPSELDAGMAISEYARQLMTEALDEDVVDDE